MRAIILLSGGLDSTVVLALAKESGRDPIAISFNYGQRHKRELRAAEEISQFYAIPQKTLKIDRASIGGSALLNEGELRKGKSVKEILTPSIPSSYVPGRNTLFLAYAIVQAELEEAAEIHIGANLLDRGGYPDCRPEFIASFQQVANCATKQAQEGRSPKIVAPLINWDKAEIIAQGKRLNVPFELTFSCYDPVDGERACGSCDACVLRKEGFKRA